MTILFAIAGAIVGYIVGGFVIVPIISAIEDRTEYSTRMPGFRFFVGLILFACTIAGAWIGASLG